MRDIKFRAWYSGEDEQQMLFVGDSFGTSHPLDCCKYAMEGQPVELMQYTGLKDKNGVEIYEGDIVGRCSQGQYWSIEWGSFCDAAFYGFNQLNSCRRLVSDTSDIDCGAIIEIREGEVLQCAVIGNIYENPEMLKEI